MRCHACAPHSRCVPLSPILHGRILASFHRIPPSRAQIPIYQRRSVLNGMVCESYASNIRHPESPNPTSARFSRARRTKRQSDLGYYNLFKKKMLVFPPLREGGDVSTRTKIQTGDLLPLPVASHPLLIRPIVPIDPRTPVQTMIQADAISSLPSLVRFRRLSLFFPFFVDSHFLSSGCSWNPPTEPLFIYICSSGRRSVSANRVITPHSSLWYL